MSVYWELLLGLLLGVLIGLSTLMFLVREETNEP